MRVTGGEMGDPERCRSCEGPLQPDETCVCDVCLPHLPIDEIEDLIDDPERWRQALEAGVKPVSRWDILAPLAVAILLPLILIKATLGGHGLVGYLLGDDGD